MDCFFYHNFSFLSFNFYKIFQYLYSFWRQHRLRMKLKPIYRIFFMLYRHNLAVFCLSCDLQAVRKSISLHCQRMISGCFYGTAQSCKQRTIRTKCHQTFLSVHQFFCRSDHCLIGLTYSLMSQTDSQYRDLSLKFSHHVYTYSCFIGIARSRRKKDMGRIPFFDFFQSHLVVSDHLDVRPDGPQILDQVVSKAVVIVNH